MQNSKSNIKAPPLPDRIEEDNDAKTIPANSAWELSFEPESEENRSETETPYPYEKEPSTSKETSTSPATVTAYENRPEDVLPKQQQRINIPLMAWLNSKAAIAAISAILALTFYVLLNRAAAPQPSQEPQPAQPTQAVQPPEKVGYAPRPPSPSSQPVSPSPVVVTEPIVMPVEVPFDLNAYKKRRERIEQILFEIAGDKSSKDLKPGGYQTLEALWDQMVTLSGRDTLSKIVGGMLDQEFKTQQAGATIPWDRLWKLGMTLYHAASIEIDSVEEEFRKYNNPKVKADLARHRQWLAKWLLGERGVYCQIRQRFWQQVKTGNPPIPEGERERISEIRQERKRHLDKLGRPDTKLYNFCKKNILDPIK